MRQHLHVARGRPRVGGAELVGEQHHAVLGRVVDHRGRQHAVGAMVQVAVPPPVVARAEHRGVGGEQAAGAALAGSRQQQDQGHRPKRHQGLAPADQQQGHHRQRRQGQNEEACRPQGGQQVAHQHRATERTQPLPEEQPAGQGCTGLGVQIVLQAKRNGGAQEEAGQARRGPGAGQDAQVEAQVRVHENPAQARRRAFVQAQRKHRRSQPDGHDHRPVAAQAQQQRRAQGGPQGEAHQAGGHHAGEGGLEAVQKKRQPAQHVDLQAQHHQAR